MKCNYLYADPAWNFSDPLSMSSTKRGASAQYQTLNLDDIKKLKVNELAADDAFLALWVPSSLLQAGLDCMKEWGFRQTQTLIWNKIKKDPLNKLAAALKKATKKYEKKELVKEIDNIISEFDLSESLSFGMGRLFRQTHELALIGVRGKIYNRLKNKSQRSVHFSQNLKHSAKPENLQESIEKMFPDFDGKSVELFARRERPGWICVGNQCPGSLNEDIRDSIERLIKL